MKRSGPIVTVLFILLAASAVLLLLPLSTCPDCDLPPTARSPGDIPLGCPRCGDAGKVSTANRWTRRGLDPRLTALIQATRVPVENLRHRSEPILEALGADGSGEFGYADARFLDDGGDRLLTAYVHYFPRFTLPNRWTLVLFAPDAAILDRVELRCTGCTGKVSSGWGQGGPGSRYFRLSAAPTDPWAFRVVRDSGESLLTATELRVHARGGRLEVEVVPVKRVVAVLLVVAAALGAFVPFPGCPDCLATAPPIGAFPPGCPRCGDSGRSSAFERVRRRSLDRDLALLVSDLGPDPFTVALQRLLDRSKRSLDLPDTWVGAALFVSDGSRRVVARVGPSLRPAGPVEDAAILFDVDGSVLDLVLAGSAEGDHDLDAHLEPGGTLRIEAPSDSRPHRFNVRRGSERVELRGSALILRPAGDRLEVVVDP